MGCIGAWVLYHLVKQGAQAVSFDLSDSRHRINLLLSPEEQQAIQFLQGDLTNTQQVADAIQKNGITHIVHLAALQVPFCRANPVLGAQVNVVGTVNIFEGARYAGIKHLAYASSVAVYGPPSDYPPGLVANDALRSPGNLYGVYKQACEGMARIYWAENGISSTGLLPYTVYGLGRDQGMTSEPTKAMLAAAAGQPYHIGFGGSQQLQWASDVAAQFIEAARKPLGGAYTFNLGGKPAAIDTVADIIRQVKPGAQITVSDKTLGLPDGFDDTELRKHFDTVYETSLDTGIQQTIESFEAALSKGLIAFKAQ